MISYIIDKLFKIISAIKELLVGKSSIENEKTNYNFDDIRNAFKVARECKGKPTMILAHTIKGKGVSYMENAANWHGVAPNEEQLKIALEELEGK